MAKKQTFGDKGANKKAAKNSIKVVVSEINPKNNRWRFSEKMIKVPEGQDFEQYADKIVLGK
jgi:hypothetical protein